MRQGQLEKDIRNPQLSRNNFSNLKGALLLFVLFFGCRQSGNKIQGTWAYIKEVENGKELRSSAQEGNQVKYLENGEMQLFHNNKRYGLAIYHYKLRGDSLFIVNIQIDTTGRVDTLGTLTGLVSIKSDTMSIKHGTKTIYYKRERD